MIKFGAGVHTRAHNFQVRHTSLYYFWTWYRLQCILQIFKARLSRTGFLRFQQVWTESFLTPGSCTYAQQKPTCLQYNSPWTWDNARRFNNWMVSAEREERAETTRYFSFQKLSEYILPYWDREWYASHRPTQGKIMWLVRSGFTSLNAPALDTGRTWRTCSVLSHFKLFCSEKWIRGMKTDWFILPHFQSTYHRHCSRALLQAHSMPLTPTQGPLSGWDYLR